MSFPLSLPTSHVPDRMAAPSLRWGILGTGWIAERFVQAVNSFTGQQIRAVGSRTETSAKDFAGRMGIPQSWGSYSDLVGDPEIDVIYIATPHNAHHPCAKLALEAGKHVLIEKPIALNAELARDIANTAATRKLFCMEAMWTFFLPKFDVIRQVLDAGVLGDIHTVIADNGEYFTSDHRIMRQDLAGGPLLDLGTYPIGLAHSVLGGADRISAYGQPAPTGVNGQTSVILSHPAGGQSVINTTLFSNTPTGATIAGSKATITIPGVFYRPGDFTLTSADQSQQLQYTENAYGYDGLSFQAAEVARRISAGEIQSPIRPLVDSIGTLAIIDEIRRQIGAPFDEEM